MGLQGVHAGPNKIKQKKGTNKEKGGCAPSLQWALVFQKGQGPNGLHNNL